MPHIFLGIWSNSFYLVTSKLLDYGESDAEEIFCVEI